MRDEPTSALRGESVLLRQGLPDDAEMVARIAGEPEVATWWGDFGLEDVQREFVGSSDGFVIEGEGEVVGAIQYAEENEPMYRHAGIDLFITTSRQGQGLGTEAIRILARYLFEERGHHRLTIDPAEDNTRAIRVYEKIGFRSVGVMRRYERSPDGTWRNGLLMDMLREDFEEPPGRPSL